MNRLHSILKIEIQMSRSMMHFAVFLLFAFAATFYILKKADQAVEEIDRIQADNANSLVQTRRELGVGDDNAPANFTPSEVEGWQTYRNEEYGFEFNYPSSVGVIIKRAYGITSDIIVQEIPSEGAPYVLAVMAPKVDMESWGDASYGESEYKKSQEITVGAGKVLVSFSKDNSNIPNTWHSASALFENRAIRVSISMIGIMNIEEVEQESIFKALLSTFKFSK